MKKKIAFLLAGLLLSQSAFPALAEELSEPFAAMSEMTEDVGGSDNAGESEADTELMAKEQESETEQEPKEETEAVETAEPEAEEMPESGRAGTDEQKPAAETEEEEFIIEPDLIEPEEEPGKTEPDVAEAVPAADTENGVPIDEAHFPDSMFRYYLRNYLPSELNDYDEFLTEAELASVESIGVNCYDIYDLTGIEYFTNLKTLTCVENHLESLDVSKNTKLVDLTCEQNQLTDLDLSANTNLEYLNCTRNPKLVKLNLSKNVNLRRLDCVDCQITSLDLRNCTKLEDINCENNRLSDLDVSKNSSLIWMRCSYNNLKNLNLQQNASLVQLYCEGNPLTSLDVSKNSKLEILSCADDGLTQLDVSKNAGLWYLDCNGNKLTDLDVSKNRKLLEVRCERNRLKVLDLSKSANLLNCSLKDNETDAYAAKVGSVWKVNIESLVGRQNIGKVSFVPAKGMKYKYADGMLAIAGSSMPKEVTYQYDTGLSNRNMSAAYLTVKINLLPEPEKATVGFTKESLSLNVGGSLSLKGYVTGLQTGDSISRWRSFSPNIASVDAQGNVKALRAGQTYIAVGTKNGAVAKLLLNVQDTAVHTTAISGLHTGIALESGKSVTLRPVLSPANSQDPVIYKSVAPNVATVSANGVVRGVRAGSAYVYVKSGTVYKKILVKVTAPSLKAITGVRATGSLYVNATYQLRPQRYPVGSAGVFYYKSSNPAVAVVDKDGKITAKKQGSTVITVTARNVSTTMKLTVKQR